MTETNDLLITFREAGIGRMFDKYKLSSIPDAEVARLWVQEQMEHDLEAGRPIWVTGDDHISCVVAHCIAKSALARDFRVRVLSLVDIRRELDEDDTDLFDLDLLVMIDFDNPAFEKNPYHDREIADIEDTLIRMIRLERSVLFHLSQNQTWWTPRLMNEIAKGEQMIVLGDVE